MRMYFRTDYYSYVATIDTFVQLKKGNAYEVFADLDEYYIIMMDGMPFEKELGIVVVIPKEDLEDDVYVVTGKSEKLEEGGGGDMIGIDHREQGRKERALAEYYRTLARYPVECGEPITYQLSEEQLKQVLCGEVTVDELIKRGEVSGS